MRSRRTTPRRPAACVGSVAAVLALVVMTGCGGASGPKAHTARIYLTGPNGKQLISAPSLAYVKNGLAILARQRVPGGYVTFLAKRYRFEGHETSELAERIEERRGSRLVSTGGGGVSTMARAGLPLTLEVGQVCVAGHTQVILYGLLSAPADHVTASNGHSEWTLKRAAVPTQFGSGGVLVYAVLPAGNDLVLARTPDDRVVSRNIYKTTMSCG